MWKLLFVVQIVVLSNVNAQKIDPSGGYEFLLTGQLTGRDLGMLILWYPDTSGKYIRDTTYLQKGTFSFRGFISYPSFAHLFGSEKNGNRVSFFLAPGIQTINIKENQFESAHFKGSKTQDLYYALNQELTKLDFKIRRLILQADSLKAKSLKFNNQEIKKQIEEIDSETDRIRKEVDDTQSRFIQDHPDSYASITILLSIINRFPANLSRSLFNSLNPELRESRIGKMCDNELQELERLTAGRHLSDFMIKVEKGKPLTLKKLRGKYVLLDFWASWCIPCRKETPGLKKSFELYHSKGLEIICISLDTDTSDWKKAIAVDETEYWHHILINEETKPIFEAIKFIPQKLLIDRDGKIIWSSLESNDQDWEAIFLQHLNS